MPDEKLGPQHDREEHLRAAKAEATAAAVRDQELLATRAARKALAADHLAKKD